MDKTLKRQATIAMMIAIVDYFKGEVILNTKEVFKAHNDKNDTVIITMNNGTTCCIGDMDIDILADAINEWRTNNKDKFDSVCSFLRPL